MRHTHYTLVGKRFIASRGEFISAHAEKCVYYDTNKTRWRCSDCWSTNLKESLKEASIGLLP